MQPVEGDAGAGSVVPAASRPEAPAAVVPSATYVARAASRGVAGLVATSALTNVLQLISSLVLARTVAPAQYGAFAVGATVVGFGRFLGDCGAGSVLIQEPGPGEADDRELGQAFALQSVLSLLAAGVLIAAAPLLRAAFSAPADATWIVVILALTLVIEAPGVVPKVRLRRAQRFQRLQLFSFIGLLALYATQITGMARGHGVAALVAAQVVGSTVTVLALLASGGRLVRPVLSGAGALAWRGLAYQGTLVVQAVFSVASLMVVGLVLSTRQLGLWTWSTVLATPLISLALSLHGVVFPSLARLHEHHGDRHREAVQTIARLQFLFVSLAVGLLCGLAVPTVRLLFEPRWLDATSAARAALVGVLPLVLSTLLAAAVESTGRPDIRLKSMTTSCVLGIAAAVVLVPLFSVTGAAVAIYLLVPLLDAAFLLRAAPLDIRRALLDAFLVGGSAFLLAEALSGRVHDLRGLVLAAAVVGVVGLLLLPLVDRGPLRQGWATLRAR